MTEKIQQMLQELEKGGVKFLPWIGDKYEEGIYYDEEGKLRYGNGKGKKVLVLGESFYWGDEDDDAEENNSEASRFVESLIKQVISENPDFNIRTFKRFENAFAYENEEWGLTQRQDFWNHLIFYDYVQEPLKYPRLSPTEEQFEDSEKSFWKVIEICNPDIIIAWGKRLYNHLPPEGEQGKDIECDDDSVETWIYRNNIRVIPIIHPAAPMFSTKRIFNILKRICNG